jgi:hypothetical protein
MKLPDTPGDRPVYEGEIATYWFDGEVLVSRSKSVKRTVELIRNNVAFVRKITNNKPVPLLIYLTNSPVPDKATRKFSSEMIPKIYSRMAMVSDAGLSQLIMKMVFALKAPPVPTKSFSNAQDAMKWLCEK